MRVNNEVKVAEAEAKKKVVLAQAEAEVNRLKQQSLTPAILQARWIEKWDGKLPDTYAGGNIPGMILNK